MALIEESPRQRGATKTLRRDQSSDTTCLRSRETLIYCGSLKREWIQSERLDEAADPGGP